MARAKKEQSHDVGSTEATVDMDSTSSAPASVAAPSAPPKPLVFGLEKNPPLHLLNKSAMANQADRKKSTYDAAQRLLSKAFNQKF